MKSSGFQSDGLAELWSIPFMRIIGRSPIDAAGALVQCNVGNHGVNVSSFSAPQVPAEWGDSTLGDLRER